MNKIYKVIWSKAKNCYVAVSELAKSHTKGSRLRSCSSVGSKMLVSAAVVLSLTGGFSTPVFAAVNIETNKVTIDANNPSIVRWTDDKDLLTINSSGEAVFKSTTGVTTFYIGNANGDNGHNVYWGTGSATGNYATAWGKSTTATSTAATAFGMDGTTAGAEAATAWGKNTHATGGESTTWGINTHASGTDATAFGMDTYALGNGSTAWGKDTHAEAFDNTTAFGNHTHAKAKEATAFGHTTTASAEMATAWGFMTTASGSTSTAWGEGTTADSDEATAFGRYTRALGQQSTAFGEQTLANNSKAIAFGHGTVPTDLKGITLNDAFAEQYKGAALGLQSIAGMGGSTYTGAQYAIAFGDGAKAKGEGSFALGIGSVAESMGTVALGKFSVATAEDTGHQGYSVKKSKTGEGSGSGTPGNSGDINQGYVWTPNLGNVSVGDASKQNTRRITGLAAGYDLTDAVNVAQLYDLRDQIVSSSSDWQLVDSDGVKGGSKEYEVDAKTKKVTLKVVNNKDNSETPAEEQYVIDLSNLAGDKVTVSKGDNVASVISDSTTTPGTTDWKINVENLKYAATKGNAGTVKLADGLMFNDGNYTTATASANGNITIDVDVDKLPAYTWDVGVAANGEQSAYKSTVAKTQQVQFVAGNGVTITGEGDDTASTKKITISAGDKVTVSKGDNVASVISDSTTTPGTTDWKINVENLKYAATKGNAGTVKLADGLMFNDGNYTTATASANGNITIDVDVDKLPAYTWDVGVAANGEQSAYKSTVAKTQQVQFVAGNGVTITGEGDDTASTKKITISAAPAEDIHLAGVSVDAKGNLTFKMSDNTTKYTVNLKGTGGTTVTGDGNNTVTINSTEGGGGGHSDYSTVAGDGKTTKVTPDANSSSQTNYIVTGSVVAGDEKDGENGDTKSTVTYKDGKGVVTIHNELNGEPTTTVTIDGITDTKVTGGSVVEGDNGKYNINLTNNIDASPVTIKDLHDYYLDLNETNYNSSNKTIHLELNNGEKKDLVLNNLISNEDTLWTSQVNGDNVQDIKAGGTQNFVDGKNIKVTKEGADIKISTDTDVEFDNVTVNKTVKVGDTLIEGDKIATNTVNTQTIKLGDTTIKQGDDNRITYNTKSGDTYNIATLKDGMDFAGDDGKAIHKNLAEQLDVVGGAAEKASKDNIYTYNDNGKIHINLAKDIEGVDTVTVNKTINVGGNTTITGDTITTRIVNVGDTTINNNGVTIKNGPSVTKNGIDAGGKKITNVAPGTDGTDAVNVDQLNSAISQVGGDAINRLGDQMNRLDNSTRKGIAGAAALAALHPLDFDPDDKWEFSAGVGNYRGETAAAIGAFYHPNDDTIFSLGATVGNGENLVNGGVTFRFGQQNHQSRSKKAMAKEIVELRAEVAELKAMVYSMANGRMPGLDLTKSEEFPDTPENHWAYDYVSVLAGNGVLEGYQDGFFKGDRTLTRYEMAAIIYRAMMRGVDVDERMKEEFAPELARVKVDTLTSHSDGTPSIQRVRVIKGRE